MYKPKHCHSSIHLVAAAATVKNTYVALCILRLRCRYADVRVGLNDTWANLEAAIEAGETEIAPSTLYAVACIQEGCPFVNGSPQNSFVPGVRPCPVPGLCP
jgi:hypothetical protein